MAGTFEGRKKEQGSFFFTALTFPDITCYVPRAYGPLPNSPGKDAGDRALSTLQHPYAPASRPQVPVA